MRQAVVANAGSQATKFAKGSARRIAFVTIGQAPRDDLVPDLLAALDDLDVEATEFGALDELNDAEIDALAPGSDEPRLVTRLRNGREVVVARAEIEALLGGLLRRLDTMGFDAIVLLCTGRFEGLRPRTRLIEAQTVVDEKAAALIGTGASLGILVPHEEQVAGFHEIAAADHKLRFSHASPYGDMRFSAAGHELADTDVIVMHCMGYTEAMRQEVAEASGRPVLLARQILGAAVREAAEPHEAAPTRNAAQS